MNFLNLLHTQVLSLITRFLALVTVGLARSTFRSEKHIFLDSVLTVFRGSNAFKASQKFLVATIICTILAFGMVVTPAEASIPYVRKEAHSPEAQKDIESLKVALAKMRQMDCSNPLSWYYQGAIHWVPTNEDQMKYLESDPLCSSYTKSNHELKTAWDNCTHLDGKNPNHQTSDHNFLVWHRFYLYHFENIVRSLSGNENFAMPYWRYVSLNSTGKNSGDDTILTMPEAFSDTAKDNSLYENGRFSKLLKGEKIEQEFAEKSLYKGVQDIKRSTSFIDFSSKIETAPHNKMHNYIGTGLSGPAPDPQIKFNKIFNGVFNGDTTATPEKGDGLMTDVESAGFDPIFWMHHGNIDRLWDQWTNLHKQYITSNDLHVDDQDDWKYAFFNPEVLPDGTITSKQVNYTLEDVIGKVYNLGYKYDDTPMVQPPSKRLLAEVNQPSAPPTPLASQEVGKVVGSDRPIDLQLPVNPQMETQLRRLRSGNSIPTATKGFTLEINVTYTGRPYGSYDVFLNLPDEESKRDIDTYYAGSISFFVIPSAEPVTKTFQFDITDELLLQLDKLGEAMDNKNIAVSIRKASGKEDESVKIEQISLYAY